MTHENDIPEYALQPARAPKNIEAEGIYSKEKITYPADEQTILYQFEEDILVPDTKSDMREILLMDGTADLTPSRKKIFPKIDDILGMSGTITIRTLYNPETEMKEPVSISSRIPYKYQWNLSPANPAEGIFSCRIKKMESMIINERKFRVKVSLEFTVQMFCEKEFQFFDGLRDEPLQLKHRETAITCLSMIKRDEVSVDETFKSKDAAARPECILKQDFVIAENYRQLTTEKVVINGFIFISLLYSALTEEGEKQRTVLCQHNQRIEFTQFISIEKERRGKNWSAARTVFSSKDLSVSIQCDEENSDDVHFHITGDVLTQVELYERRKRKVVVDAYHREKNFMCQVSQSHISNLSDSAVSESAVREIVNLPPDIKALETVYCSAQILEYTCSSEKGRVIVTGKLSFNMLWRSRDMVFRVEKKVSDFRGSVDMEGVFSGQKSACRPLIKTAWAEMINEKQIEINAVLLLHVETFDDGEIILLENPRFADSIKEREYPMVIAAMKAEESLWDVAKRYQTTEENIRTANRLEAEAVPEAGRRLLIIK